MRAQGKRNLKIAVAHSAAGWLTLVDADERAVGGTRKREPIYLSGGVLLEYMPG